MEVEDAWIGNADKEAAPESWGGIRHSVSPRQTLLHKCRAMTMSGLGVGLYNLP